VEYQEIKKEKKDFLMELCTKFPLVRAKLTTFALGCPVFVAFATKRWHFSQEKPIFARTSGKLVHNYALKSVFLHFRRLCLLLAGWGVNNYHTNINSAWKSMLN